MSTPAHPTLDALRVATSSLELFERNPRRGDVEAIKRSLERHGQYRPIVVNARTQQVLAGNHTLLAARELGWSEVAATFVDVDDDLAARIVLADNRTPELAAFDEGELAMLLESLDGDLEGTGYGESDLAKLLSELEPVEPDTTPQLGDVEYRLIVECDGEQHQSELLQRFEAEGLTVKALAQ